MSFSDTWMSLSHSWNLQDKVFLITGGTKGIGYTTAQSILAHGASGIIICSRSEEECSRAVISLVSEWNENHKSDRDIDSPIIKGCACDVSTKEGRLKLVNFTKDTFRGKLNGIVNNVGTNVRKPIEDQSTEEYELMMRTNVDSVYFLCKDFQDILIRTSQQNTPEPSLGCTSTATATPVSTFSTVSIVNVSSAAGVQSSGTGAVYGMTKAAVIQFTKILATEWAKYNIRVNAVAPWMTMTPLLKDAVKHDESQLDKVKEWTPLRRLAEPEEVASPITFLLMPCSSYITGQCLGIDGGLTAQGFQGPTINNH